MNDKKYIDWSLWEKAYNKPEMYKMLYEWTFNHSKEESKPKKKNRKDKVEEIEMNRFNSLLT